MALGGTYENPLFYGKIVIFGKPASTSPTAISMSRFFYLQLCDTLAR